MMTLLTSLTWAGALGDRITAVHEALPGLNGLLILIAIGIPLVAGGLLLLLDRDRVVLSRNITWVAIFVPSLLTIWLWMSYVAVSESGEYRFLTSYPTGMGSFGIALKLGLNGVSAPMFLMTGIVGLAAGLYAMQSGADRLRIQLALLLIMFGGLLGVFASVDLFFFYFFHEFALIPTFITIGIWGGRGRKGIAIEMAVYLMLGAMLSLAGIIAIYIESGLASFDIIALRAHLAEIPLADAVQHYAFGLLLFGLGILVALWPLHSWAPRGYAAATPPLAMLHAGVLKKFGLYGLAQFIVPLMPLGVISWSPVLIALALGNILVIGLITIAQRDLKVMLGYGSVMHMGYVFLGIVCLTTVGVSAAVFLMVAHGLSIALLFMLAGCIERRTGTTDLFCVGGLARQTPVLAAFFILAIFASIGLPGLANFWGELGVFIAVFDYQHWIGVLVILGVIISAVYGLRSVSRIFYGEPCEAWKLRMDREGAPRDLTRAEKAPALLLAIALLVIGCLPGAIAFSINNAVAIAYGDDTPVAQAREHAKVQPATETPEQQR